ncbi:MAG: Glutathione S-transferase, partial [uncultured Acetobacteraceae bacterium]
DQVLLPPVAEPGEGRAVPGGSRPALRAGAGGHAQGRAARARVPGDQPQRQDAGHRGRRRGRLRQQRHPALPRGQDRPVPAARRLRRTRRAAVLADVRGDRHRPLLGASGAFPAPRAGAERVRREPLPVRGEAPLRHPRRAARAAPVHAGPDLHDRRYGGVGLGAGGALHPGPGRLGDDAQPEAAVRRDQRAPRGRAGERAEGPVRLQIGDGRRGAGEHVPPHLEGGL